ncbi:MAG: NEW3 domain-containing protein [Thermovirgaceae bacterium]
MKKKSVFLMLFIVMFLVAGLLPLPPAEAFSVHVPYTGVVIGREEKAEIEVTFKNTEKDPEEIDLSLEGVSKEQWEVSLTSSKWQGHGVSRVRLGTEDSFEEVKATLTISPKKETPPGVYEFELVASSQTGVMKIIPLSVELVAEKVVPVENVLGLECSYPVIENPAGEKFTYEVSLENKGTENITTDFNLSVPAGWSGSVSPRWESDRKIQSMKIDSESTEKLSITLTPQPGVAKGRYPVAFTATFGEETAQLELEAVVTGTYDLKLMPRTQRLSFETVAGTETALVLYLWNEGTAPIENIEIYSQKPDGWDVSFEPEKIQELDSYSSRGKPDQVKVTVKAPERTIPGDYQISVSAVGEQSRDSISLRATVKVPTTWGWFGIGIIAAVLVLLFGIFWKLKRR